MPRPPLPIGTWGEISTWVAKTNNNGKADQHKSQAKFRDHDGQVRAVVRHRQEPRPPPSAPCSRSSRTAPRPDQSGDLTAKHKITHLLDLWEQEVRRTGRRRQTIPHLPRHLPARHQEPHPPRPRRTPHRRSHHPTHRHRPHQDQDHAGAPTAKTCRAILSGTMKLAVRYGAISVNPVREVDAIEATAQEPTPSPHRRRSHPPPKSLAADERAVQADLPDLVTFMLGTGVRIGEALAVLWSQVDLHH